MTQPTTTLPPTIGTDWVPAGWGSPVPPPSAPPAKRKTGRYVWGAIGLFILGAAVVSAASDKKDAVSSDGVVTTPGAAASSSGYASVNAWAGRYGADDADMLGDDMTALMAVASAGDVAGMGSSCRTFQRHLTTAESHLPSPDAQLTSALTSAYGYFGQAATACINGIAALDPDELGKMMTYLPLGTDSLKTATARLNALS